VSQRVISKPLLHPGRFGFGGVKMVPQLNTVDAMAMVVLERGKMAKVNEPHKIIGHPSKETTRKTAEYYGWKVTGKFGPCEDCGIAKSRQNNVDKDNEVCSKNPGESVFIDISSIQQKSLGCSKFWLLVVDDCTDFTAGARLLRRRPTRSTGQ
jgi:hypothetical protein